MDIVKAMRLATKELHTQLDTNLPLAQANPAMADYGQHLMVFNAWLQEIGRLVGYRPENLHPEFLLDHAHALNLLAKDMTALEFESRLEDPAIYWTSEPEPHVLNLPFLMGIEYVIKGSSLGTTFLYMTLLKRFPDASFFYMQDSALHGKTRWQSFMDKLDLYDWSQADLKSAEDGAVWAFNRFIEISAPHREIA